MNDKYQIVEFGQPADIYIINTCTVTSDADKKSKQAIKKVLKLAGKVMIAGCSARLNREKLQEEFPTVEFIDISFDRKYSPKINGKIRVNLMIEDGCENFCAYCIVPFARGKIRNKPVEQALAEANTLIDAGAREIILTGINLGEYGSKDLISLITSIISTPSLLRLRISSIEPMYITDQLLDLMASNPKICSYLNIPLQSGDDRLLGSMKRSYTTADYSKIIERVRQKLPDCGITTDVISGLPGETEEAFESSYAFIKEMGFSRLHIFSYSKRPGTEAAGMPGQVDPKTIKARYARLNELRAELMNDFAGKYIGKEAEVLVEQKGEGLTSNYIRVKFDDPLDSTGKLLKLTLEPLNVIFD